MNSSRFRKIFLICAASATAFFLIALVAAYLQKRSAELRTRDWIVQVLEHKFRSDVELADFHVKVFPRMGVSGQGLSLRYRNAPSAPPLVRIEQFSFELGFLGIFQAPHRIPRVHIQRMVITVPPRELRDPAPPESKDNAKIPQVTVSEIECDNTELLTLSNKPGKDPLDWEIHNLVLHEVALNKPFSFRGVLTNAK